MPVTHHIAGILSFGLVCLCAGAVCGQATSTGSGQAYPNKPIRIVTSEIGGSADFTVRLVAKGISGPLGQPVITDIRAGAVTGEAGRLRVLAVTSAQPSALVPGLPTVAASGVPGYEAVAMQGLFAPAKTPVAIINRLNQEVLRVLNTAEVKEQLLNSGLEANGSTPDELAAKVRAELTKWGKLIKDTGMRAN